MTLNERFALIEQQRRGEASGRQSAGRQAAVDARRRRVSSSSEVPARLATGSPSSQTAFVTKSIATKRTGSARAHRGAQLPLSKGSRPTVTTVAKGRRGTGATTIATKQKGNNNTSQRGTQTPQNRGKESGGRRRNRGRNSEGGKSPGKQTAQAPEMTTDDLDLDLDTYMGDLEEIA